MKSIDPRVGIAVAVVAVGLLAGVLTYSLTARPAADERAGSETTAVASSEATAEADSVEPTVQPAPGVQGSGSAAAAAAAVAGDSSGGSSSSDDPQPPAAPTTGGDAWKGGSVSDPKAALTVDQRKECYWKLLEAEYRAIAEAEAAYPQEVEDADLDAHYEMRFRLTDQYQAEVGAAFDLTFDGVVAILVEGAENNWPVPPLTE